MGEYSPQEYDPVNGVYIQSETPLPDYTIINISSNVRLSNFLNLSIGINNASDHTNDRFGPYVGRNYYVQFSTSN